jgi:outer membrane protein assembly factor BamB
MVHDQMKFTRVPKIFLLSLVLALVLSAAAAGQTKSGGEIALIKCWTYETGETGGEALASDDDRVFVALGGAKIEALTTDGKKIWSSEFGGDITSNILPAGSSVLVVTTIVPVDDNGTAASNLRSLSKETGLTSWTLRLPDARLHFLHAFNGSVIVVSMNGIIQSVDPKDGVVRWRREIAGAFVAKPFFSGDKALAATGGNQIFEISLATGEIGWMRKSDFVVTALGRTSGGAPAVGDERGNVSLLDPDSAKASWKFKSGGGISAILTADDHLLVASQDNFIYFLTSRNGVVGWKKRLAGRISQIAGVSGRFAITSSFEGQSAVFTDLTNGKVAGQIIFPDGEIPIFPATASGDTILLLTKRAVYAYALGACPTK